MYTRIVRSINVRYVYLIYISTTRVIHYTRSMYVYYT